MREGPSNRLAVTYRLCGFYEGDAAAAGWDLCSGIGSVHGLVGK
jgi:hypothetical protein